MKSELRLDLLPPRTKLVPRRCELRCELCREGGASIGLKTVAGAFLWWHPHCLEYWHKICQQESTWK
jgi:hypothetical protein